MPASKEEGSSAKVHQECDEASWQTSSDRYRLTSLDNIILLHLPPYAPELNPMENVWDYLRANKLSALVWDSYEAILQACRDAWLFLVNDPDRIRSIGTRDWATVSIQGGWYKLYQPALRLTHRMQGSASFWKKKQKLLLMGVRVGRNV